MTVPPVSKAAPPLDLETMRASADRLLANNAEVPSPEKLETLTLQLHGHLMLAVPEVESAVLALSEESVARVCALFCVGEARLQLSAQPGRSLSARVAHAQRLARSVRRLCGHYENEDHQCPNAPERAAYLRMLLHCSGCRDCRIVDDNGEAVGSRVTGDRLYEEYRQARRSRVLGSGL
ncbi:DUF6415 family natural product biosynthesis protein [Streptomyces violaceus]|uniref:DUF6415 family natural product biosynthesis protein n=1 Tax=Streptomyces violaceus TaxID=1936 RepID=UPI002E2C5B4C|nr:DUF6415 family natural product biosynthesis protein [Streptomyces violaceus]